LVLSFDTINAAAGGNEQRSTAIAYAAGNPIDATLVLAHGAGAGQKSSFIVDFARGLAERGIDVLTFNFLYTEQRRRVPDRTEKLEACYRAAIATARGHFGRDSVFIGGKSMGGRIATHLAAADDAEALGIAGAVLLGYPLHPPGKPDQLRAAHLPRIRVPMLIVQGERDAFGTPDELRPVLRKLKAKSQLYAVEGGDHSFKVPKSAGTPQAKIHVRVLDEIDRWLRATAGI